MRLAILLPALLVLLALPAYAQESDEDALYQISDVAVDVTADSATHARDQAIMQAQHNAFDQLLTRLGADTALEQKLDNDTLASMVQAFEVQQERLSKVRYLGTFTVRFKPPAVRAFLGKRGSAYNEARSKPVIVLPILNTGARVVLWEDSTPWRTAWESVTGKGGLVPIVVPSGDLDDIAKIGTHEAMNGKEEAFQALMNKYQAGSVVVAVLNADPDNLDPKQPIKIALQRYDMNGKSGGSESISLTPASDTKALTALISDGVKQVRSRLESGWRQSTKMPKGAIAHLPVAVPIGSLADWNEIKAKLATVPAISRANVLSLTRDTANVDLEFYGDIQQLQASLAQHNLSLESSSFTGAWTLREEP